MIELIEKDNAVIFDVVIVPRALRSEIVSGETSKSKRIKIINMTWRAFEQAIK